MTTRVIDVRKILDGKYDPGEFPAIYVGRRMGTRLAQHPLANPYRVDRNACVEERRACQAKYKVWLDAHPAGKELLYTLAQQVKATGYPLACWCGNYPDDPGLICHAVVLAEQVDRILAEG